ncbi:putative phage holin [compost metagenome]
MAEPGSGSIAVAGLLGTLGVALAVPGVDMNAVVGSFGGALFFVLWARDLSVLARMGYLLVSWIGGYVSAAEAIGRGWTDYSGLPALISAALIVTALVGMIEWMRGGQAPGWLRIVIAWIRALVGAGGKNG